MEGDPCSSAPPAVEGSERGTEGRGGERRTFVVNDKVVCKPLGSRKAYNVEPTSGDDVVEGEGGGGWSLCVQRLPDPG